MLDRANSETNDSNRESDENIFETFTNPEPGAYDFGFNIRIPFDIVKNLPLNHGNDEHDSDGIFIRNPFMGAGAVKSDVLSFSGLKWQLQLRRIVQLEQEDSMFRLRLKACGSERSDWSFSFGRIVLFWRPKNSIRFPFELPIIQWPQQFHCIFFTKTHRLFEAGFQEIENLDFLWSDVFGTSFAEELFDQEMLHDGFEFGVLVRGVTEMTQWPNYAYSAVDSRSLPMSERVQLVLRSGSRYSVPRKTLAIASDYFRLRLQDLEGNSDQFSDQLKIDDEFFANESKDTFHLFLLCLLPPALPLNLAAQKTKQFYQVLRLADKYQCMELKSLLSNWIISLPMSSPVFGSPILRIRYGDLYHLPMVVSHTIENMSGPTLRKGLDDAETANISTRSKALMFDRLREMKMTHELQDL